ncbi:BLOC-1-related complex subunit 8 homolog [Dysidea avara]|uniref:BLOC-1-related complex subunit 8 homolog n=1 Tax=Dysidea avara TaxID=196820 RepID=UPI00331E97AD
MRSDPEVGVFEMVSTPNRITHFEELEARNKVTKICQKLNEGIYVATNEPSLGMYRVQEHVRFNVPKLARCTKELQNMQSKIEGSSYDVEYDTETLKKMASITQFTTIRDKIRRAIEIRQSWEKKEYEKKLTGGLNKKTNLPVNASSGSYLAQSLISSGQVPTNTDQDNAEDVNESFEDITDTLVSDPVTDYSVVSEPKVGFTLPSLDPRTLHYAANRSDSPDFVPKSFDANV